MKCENSPQFDLRCLVTLHSKLPGNRNQILGFFIKNNFLKSTIGDALALECNGGIEAVFERYNALALQVLGGP